MRNRTLVALIAVGARQPTELGDAVHFDRYGARMGAERAAEALVWRVRVSWRGMGTDRAAAFAPSALAASWLTCACPARVRVDRSTCTHHVDRAWSSERGVGLSSGASARVLAFGAVAQARAAGVTEVSRGRQRRLRVLGAPACRRRSNSSAGCGRSASEISSSVLRKRCKRSKGCARPSPPQQVRCQAVKRSRRSTRVALSSLVRALRPGF